MLVKRVWRQVGAVWPAHHSVFVYHRLSKQLRVCERFKDRTKKAIRQFRDPRNSVLERHFQSISIEGAH